MDRSSQTGSGFALERDQPELYHDIEQFIYEDKAFVEIDGTVWLIESYATEPIDEIVLVAKD